MFEHYPPQLRKLIAQRTIGQSAITFPTSYMRKLPNKLKWEIVRPTKDGIVTLTISNNSSMMEFSEYLKSCEVEFEIFELT